jgi:hypothetical protein
VRHLGACRNLAGESRDSSCDHPNAGSDLRTFTAHLNFSSF